MSLSPEDRRARMDALRKSFLEQLPRMAGQAFALLGACRADPGSERACDEARLRLHSLAGTLGTFGYLSAVEGIRSLERLVPSETGSSPELDRVIAAVRSQIETICGCLVEGEAS